jgi:hypothetical protein
MQEAVLVTWLALMDREPRILTGIMVKGNMGAAPKASVIVGL